MSGLAVKLYNLSVIDVPEDQESVTGVICGCNTNCFYREQVFASATSDFWKKDYSDFLAWKIAAADTITYEIWKAGALVATVSDDTYGTYYSTFTNYPLLTGFLVDWTSVFDAFSGGKYNIKIQKTILGNTSTFISRDFSLNAYDEALADGSIKIETYQTGNILRSAFNYTDLIEGGWYSSYRLGGVFGKKTPTLIEDNYLDSSYNLLQIRPSIELEYTLQTDLIPETLATLISTDNILANDILLTSYNSNNNEQLRRVNVAPSSFEDTNHFDNGKLRYTIKFKEKVQNLIKRNF